MRILARRAGALGAALLSRFRASRSPRHAADAYYDFLMARHLEARGDSKGAQAPLEKAVAARSEVGRSPRRARGIPFAPRRGRRRGARRQGSASARRRQLRGAPRARHVVCRRDPKIPAVGQAAETAASALVTQAISHLERVTDNPAGLTDLNLQYTLGRLYTRDRPGRQGHPGADARRQREPAVGAGPSRAGAGVRRRARHQQRDRCARRRSSMTSRASRTCSASSRSRPGG